LNTDLNIVEMAATWVLVNKPAGLLAVPGRGEAGADNVATRLQRQVADALVVHRLDMATSGLMLFARGPAAQRALSKAFAARQVHKRYVAVVDGNVAGEQGRIDLPLAADWPNRPRQQVDAERGKPSLTWWRVLAREGACTRLQLEPVTGRSHQLRVHLASLGHAIVGDTLYASPAVAAASPRLLLHASHLAFNDPGNGQPRAYDSGVPF
jgi:tRNA pseudouridine32 synthase/23S rRNA pseudouridine746 synthase